MSFTIHEKLDKVYSLYKPERLKLSMERFTLLDNGQKMFDRYPFCIGFPYFNAYNVNHSPIERIHAYLDAFIFMHQFDDDTIPYIFPGLNHATIPSMFGAKEVACGIETTCESMIRCVEDIWQLPKPSIIPGSAAEKWITMDEYILKETKGRIPVNVCDMQGPFDSCAQIWSYQDMFVCAYEDPSAYHHIISLLTDAFVIMWKKQKEIMGDLFLGTHLFSQGWVPQDCGAAISADSLVMVSPEFFEKFYFEHFCRINDELGPLTIHSCGDFRQVIPQLCELPGIKAINASQLNARQIHEAGCDPKVQLLLAVIYDDFENEIQYVKEHGLNVRYVIYGTTPMTEEKYEKPWLWTKEDLDESKRRIERIKNLMKV